MQLTCWFPEPLRGNTKPSAGLFQPSQARDFRSAVLDRLGDTHPANTPGVIATG
jgi:hypothetical protein